MIFYIIGIYLFLIPTILYSDTNPPASIQIPIYTINDNDYISVHNYAMVNNDDLTFYDEKKKIGIKSSRYNIIFSQNSSFIKINNKIYHMFLPVIYDENNFFIPVHPFLNIMNSIFPAINFVNTSGEKLIIYNNYNITDINIINKTNGIIIEINTLVEFDKNIISGAITQGGWLSLTIPQGIVDSLKIVNSKKQYPVNRIRSVQYDESAQISFLISNKIDEFEIYTTNNKININLHMNTEQNIQKIKTMREKWLLDTIVLDPGHGGKDPGAIGSGGLQEKTITLDVAKKLGKLLEDNLGVKVIHTRTDDSFIPLWKRTKIANDSNGKLFISLHVNSSNHAKSATGFETYLLRPGKWDDAVEIVKRENSVIKLEKESHKYKDFTNEQFIMASMAQNEFIKESEFLASEIQKQLDRSLNIKNRGVKQAGFYVLYGANMPNVLIELGFISNKKDVRILNKSRYRQKMAEAVFKAILTFKEKYEMPIINEQ